MDVVMTIRSARTAGFGAMSLACMTLAVGASAPAAAQAPADFYRNKTVTIMLGHPPGGS